MGWCYGAIMGLRCSPRVRSRTEARGGKRGKGGTGVTNFDLGVGLDLAGIDRLFSNGVGGECAAAREGGG